MVDGEMEVVIAGIQQLGVGIPDVDEAFAWYRKAFGLDVPVFREAAEAPYMTRYTGNAVQSRDATLAINTAGGGGFEIWQYTSRTPVAPASPPRLGDLGIFAGRIKTAAINTAYQSLVQDGANVVSGIVTDPGGARRFSLVDPWGNCFIVVESESWFSRRKTPTGGVEGALIGVSDIDASLPFYREVLGYDAVVYDVSGTFEDFTGIDGGGETFRRVLLTHAAERAGAFSRMFGRTHLELVQRTSGGSPGAIFADRFWGDLGFIHLCFDVAGMDELKARCDRVGHPFTIDSGTSFDMGEAGGRFSYVEDPDGTLIEFVETHKLPLVKAIRWYLDLRKRDPRRPLPDWMLRLMGLGRVRD